MECQHSSRKEVGKSGGEVAAAGSIGDLGGVPSLCVAGHWLSGCVAKVGRRQCEGAAERGVRQARQASSCGDLGQRGASGVYRAAGQSGTPFATSHPSHARSTPHAYAHVSRPTRTQTKNELRETQSCTRRLESPLQTSLPRSLHCEMKSSLAVRGPKSIARISLDTGCARETRTC